MCARAGQGAAVRALRAAYLDEVEGLIDRGLGVEGEAGVDLGGDAAGDDLKDLSAELDQETVESRVDLLAAMLLSVVDGHCHQLRVLGCLGGRLN